MEEIEALQTCPNCNREIPSANFMIHSAHCARNIKICNVCKEPVPQSDLDEHHDKLHLLLPCKKCRELVRGTDMEDHIRDSCAFTMQTCRFCSLELRRRDVPPHERYCGARTERCADCGEYVMLRYRQLHLESNHGFLRLDEDSPPRPVRRPLVNYPPNWPIARAKNVNRCIDYPGKMNDGPLGNWCRRRRDMDSEEEDAVAAAERMKRKIMATYSYCGPEGDPPSPSAAEENPPPTTPSPTRPAPNTNGLPKYSSKRTNDQPQVNTTVVPQDKVQKNLAAARGAVKKRHAPPPPSAPVPDERRDLPYYSALQRRQDEDRRRQEQTAYNLSVGLPPVLSPAAKLEKLRKMDALLQNREDDNSHKSKQERVRENNNVSPDVGHTLGRAAASLKTANGEPSSTSTVPQDADVENERNKLKDVKPMSPEEFMERFNELQLRKEPRAVADAGRYGDIRSSLRELRRGLNEVTAPYNNNNAAVDSHAPSDADTACGNSAALDTADSNQLDEARAPSPVDNAGAEPELRVPCEFCSEPQPALDLARHESWCRRRVDPPWDEDEPVIPCEFCTETLPYYLITEHQELCGREANLLYPD